MVVTNTEAQTDNTPVCDKEVQIEALIVREKETQTIKTRCRNKEIQVDLQPKIVMMDNDSRIITLKKDLARAQKK